MENKNGKRIGVYISEDLLDQCDVAVGKTNAESRSEFIESRKAVGFQPLFRGFRAIGLIKVPLLFLRKAFTLHG